MARAQIHKERTIYMRGADDMDSNLPVGPSRTEQRI